MNRNLINTKKIEFETNFETYSNTGFEVPITGTTDSRFLWMAATCSSGKPGASEQYIAPIFRVEE
jgi:hypothetical protein